MSWKQESARHSMASRGISTKTQIKKIQSIHNKSEILDIKSKDVLERTDKLMKKIYELYEELHFKSKEYKDNNELDKAKEYYDMARDLYNIHSNMAKSIVEYRRYVDYNHFENDIKRIKEIEKVLK